MHGQNSSSIVSYVRLKEVDHQITHENHILVTRFIQKTQYARACTVACCALTSHNTKVCLIFLTPHSNHNGVHLVSRGKALTLSKC